jgi:hypothetical protein
MLEFNNNCGCDSGSLNGFTDPSCPAPSVVTWNSIQGKPSCFTPCPHTHVPADIIGLEAYIQSVEYVGNSTTTNSIQLTTPSGVLNANLRLSANAGTGYKVPLSILSDGLIAQIPFASGSNAGILSAADWITFNNKFNTPSGTIFQYVRGDGSLATLPTAAGFVPYTGATTNVNLGIHNLTANSIIKTGGTSSQFLKADGSVDLTAYFPVPTGTISQYVRGDGTLATFPTSGGTVTSVGLSMPAAFAVANSPVTGSGILAVTATGTISQYIRGDGTLATLPGAVSFLVGSVPFGNGTGLTENNSKFFWNNTLFKLQLTDSKLEFLNTGTLGSALLEYKILADGYACLAYDQTSNSGGLTTVFKIRSFETEISGLSFGTVNGIDTQVDQIGLIYRPLAISATPGNRNKLILKNNYDATGIVAIEATAYTQVDGLAIKQSAITTFSNTNNFRILTYPTNILRFNYGGTLSGCSITLTSNAFLPIPDGYIVILKALNTITGPVQNVIVQVDPLATQTLEPFTFTKDRESVTYRYDLAGNKWDIIAIYSV